MSIISQTDQNTMELLAKVDEFTKNEKVYENKLFCIQQQVVALQASEAKLKAENEKLKGRVDIMEKCKKVWYDKCQEDPDDDPDRNGIKWSICLEGGLNYWMNEAVRYESAYDFMSIIANEATGVFHFLGERADEETAERLIPTEYMEREEFQCFNPNWEDHHN